MKISSIIRDIKSAGFGFVKVELEAELGRGGRDRDWETCEDCSGNGNHQCEHCDGEGVLESRIHTTSGRDTGEVEEIECGDCYGEGTIECDTCEGHGEVEASYGDFGDEDTCQEFIMDNVSLEAKEALNYCEFYDDGSVDSEFTFTIPVEKIEYLPEFINAFSKLADEVGGDMDVDGAGMHIAVLPIESNGVYPVRGFNLDSLKLGNFVNQVTKLLPALYVAACSGNFTRELGYRMPQISSDKYSAIHVVDRSCLEYRIFETCYQRPEAIYEFLGTIARTLEYYKDPTKKVESMGKEYMFYSHAGVKGLTATPDQVRIIKKNLKLVTPKDMTLKELQQKREINLSVGSVSKDYGKSVSRARALFKEHIKAYKTAIEAELTPSQMEEYRHFERYGYFDGYETEEQKKARVLGLRVPETNEERFISRNVAGRSVSASVMV